MWGFERRVGQGGEEHQGNPQVHHIGEKQRTQAIKVRSCRSCAWMAAAGKKEVCFNFHVREEG
jgi:sulfur transfer protein SufE